MVVVGISMVAILRALRMRVIEHEDGLRLVNFWRYRTLRWDEIEGFESRRAHGFVDYGYKRILAKMVNGKKCRVARTFS